MQKRVVFIDDGVNPDFIPAGVTFENYEACETVVKIAPPTKDVSHGTMCYQVFLNQTQAQHHLISIKVLDNETGTGNHKALVSALNWCANQNIDIINMSMGTRQFIDFAPITKAISRLQNTVIVAACNNSNTLTFPACLPDVIGVRHCDKLHGTYAYLDNPYDQIDILACAKDIPISLGNDYTQLMGEANSFAAPLITARVLEYMVQGYSKNIRNMLRNDALKDTDFCDYQLYKSMFYEWEDVSVPVILLPDFTDPAGQKLKELLNVFIQDGYRAIALSQSIKTKASDFIYSLDWRGSGNVSNQALIELYYNFVLPDIVFLQMNLDDAMALPEGMRPDVMLKPPGVCGLLLIDFDDEYVIDFAQAAETLFDLISELLK